MQGGGRRVHGAGELHLLVLYCKSNTVALLEVDGVLIDARDDSPPGSLVLEIWDDGYKKVDVLKWLISISALDQRFCLSGQIGGS